MNYNISKRRLAILVVILPLTVLIVYGVMSYLFINYLQEDMQQNTLEFEVKNYKESLLKSERENLKNKTLQLSSFIDYIDDRSSDLLKERLVDFVNTHVASTNNLCKRYRYALKRQFLKKIILTSLKNLKATENFGHIFVISKKGYVYEHFDKKLEGKNILKIKDDFDKAFVLEFNKVIDEEKEGFVGYDWYRPDSNREIMIYNLSYVKKIECFEWYIGAALFIDEMQMLSQSEVNRYIRKNIKGKDNDFFIMNKKMKLLFASKRKDEQKSVIDKEIKKRLLQKDGFYKDGDKIYYTRFIKKYNWYLVGVKDISHLGEDLKLRKVVKPGQSGYDIERSFMILAFAWFVTMLLSLYLSAIIYKQIKSYEEQINQSNEKMMFQSKQALIGELFSMIAHQWRQPINKIASIVALGRFELQSNKEIAKKDIDKSYEEIEESIEFMSETIDDFRTFYKPTTSTKMINLKTLILRSIYFLNNSIQKHDIKVIKHLQDIEMEIYRNEFLQVMLNLIKNAIDAIGTQGVIIIKLYREGDNVIISVENSGEPIDKEVASRIFEPYFTTKEDSMGLGLYMTKIIVEKHMKGEISVTRLQDGTRFTIVL